MYLVHSSLVVAVAALAIELAASAISGPRTAPDNERALLVNLALVRSAAPSVHHPGAAAVAPSAPSTSDR